MGEIGTDENFGDRPREHCIYNKYTSINPSKGPGWFNELGSWITEQLIQAYYQYVNYKKGGTWLADESDKVYQLLAHGRWLSPASSIIKLFAII